MTTHTTSFKRGAERKVVKAIMREFATQPWCRLWRQNTGKAIPVWAIQKLLGSKITRLLLRGLPLISFGLPGCGDLSGILADGRRLEIEAKAEDGQQSQLQRNFERMIREMGGVYILARSTEDVWKGLADAGFDPEATQRFTTV